MCSRVWRVTLSLDGLLSAPDILRNMLNSLCHVVFVVEAFIDLKRSSELVAVVRVEGWKMFIIDLITNYL